MKARPTSPTYRSQVASRLAQPPKKKRLFAKPIIALIVLMIIVGVTVYVSSRQPAADANKAAATTTKLGATPSQVVVAPKPVNNCAGNTTLPQLIMVSISRRHMWACNGTTQVYDAAVITGIESLPADLTPVGTYHIYAKTTNIHLKGSDSTGSWDDPVSYWMPFLDNKYGTYGFHDATWRKDSDFGNIDPNSTSTDPDKMPSHGCVETPLAAAKWLYNWASVGTTVTIKG